MNGLSTLLNIADVKYLFLPLVCDLKNILLEINGINASLQNKVKIRFVKPANGENLGDTINSVEIYNMDNENDNIPEEIDSGSMISINKSIDWVYAPYNIENEEVTNILKCKFEDCNIPLCNLTHKEIECARKIFNEIFKCEELKASYHMNNMILYSGLKKCFKKYIKNGKSCNNSCKYCKLWKHCKYEHLIK